MPRIVIARTPGEIENFRDLWEALYQPGRHTLFQSFEWNRLATRAFGSRENPAVVAVESSHGAAIIPACLTDQGVSFLGDALFDYRDFLWCGEDSLPFYAWRELADLGLPLQLTSIRGTEARKRWEYMGIPVEPFVGAPCVRAADIDGEGFEHQHTRSARLVRRLNRAGAFVGEHSGGNSALVRTICERKAAQAVSGENLFEDPVRRDFLVAVAGLSPCDIFTLESAGTLVAALITFRDCDVRRFYLTYYDHAWAHFSPGAALLFEVTRRSLAAGLDCDYMTGEQPHKLRFATASIPLYRVYASAEQLYESAAEARIAA